MMAEIEELTAPMEMGPGTAANAAIRIASLPAAPPPTIEEIAAIVQSTLDLAAAEAEQHRQKLVALVRAMLARPEAFTSDDAARTSVERFLEESDARWSARPPEPPQ